MYPAKMFDWVLNTPLFTTTFSNKKAVNRKMNRLQTFYSEQLKKFSDSKKWSCVRWHLQVKWVHFLMAPTSQMGPFLDGTYKSSGSISWWHLQVKWVHFLMAPTSQMGPFLDGTYESNGSISWWHLQVKWVHFLTEPTSQMGPFLDGTYELNGSISWWNYESNGSISWWHLRVKWVHFFETNLISLLQINVIV